MKKLAILLSASILSLSMVTPTFASNPSTVNVVQASQNVSSIEDPIAMGYHSKTVLIWKSFPKSHYIYSMIPLSINYDTEVQDGYYGILKLTNGPTDLGSSWMVGYSGTVRQLD